MAKLLQTDSALYTMVPVTGYEHLRSEYQAMFSADADDDPPDGPSPELRGHGGHPRLP